MRRTFAAAVEDRAVLIDIPIFSGTRPLVDPRLLETPQAQVAADCLVSSGALKALRRMRVEARLAVRGVEDILLYDSAWVPFFEPVSLCQSLVASDELDRVYFTGRDSGAMMFRRAEGGGAAAPVRLGIPAPTAVPACEVQGTGDENAIYTTYYMFTLVSDLGEESAPSPASALISVRTGQSVQVSGLTAPDMAGRNPLAHKRLYRGNSGSQVTLEQFVAEIGPDVETYLDSVPSAQLGEAMPTEGWLPPPDGLQGLTAVYGGALAGFVGHRLYFCPPFAPYAYPRAYSHSLEHPIVAQAATGTNLVVLTEASTYLVPCDDVTVAVPRKLEGVTPCVGPRGVASMRQGVLFPGVDGLYLVSGGSTSPQNVTAGVISEDSWRAMRPETFRAWGLGERYICFHEDVSGTRRGFIFDLSAPSMLLGLWSHATCGYLEPEGRRLHLGFESGGRTTVALWEGDRVRLSAQWMSKVFRFPSPVNMAAARVEAMFPPVLTQAQFDALREELAASFADEIAAGELGGRLGTALCGTVVFGGDILDSVNAAYSEEPVLSFQLYVDGREVYRRNVTSSAPFTLPAASGREVWVCVSGAVDVRRVSVASSMAELRAS